MKVIRFRPHSSCGGGPPFIEVEAAAPVPGSRDLLVAVKAVSVNPVDTKVRSGLVRVPDAVDVLGWDAAGTVVAIGADVQLFTPGQDVFYAGTFTRPGANAELHLVDERMVGFKPSSLSFAEPDGLAAAIRSSHCADRQTGQCRIVACRGGERAGLVRFSSSLRGASRA